MTTGNLTEHFQEFTQGDNEVLQYLANIGELAVETHSFWKINVNAFQKMYKHCHNHMILKLDASFVINKAIESRGEIKTTSSIISRALILDTLHEKYDKSQVEWTSRVQDIN